MTAQIQVELIGANGSRITEVKAAGFTTRHVIAPRESVQSIFGDVKLRSDRKATPAPKTEATPVITPETPKQTLADLLAEVDALMNPPVRVNTETPRGHHYGDAVVSRKTNYDTPLMHWYDSERKRKSDSYIAYRKAVQ